MSYQHTHNVNLGSDARSQIDQKIPFLLLIFYMIKLFLHDLEKRRIFRVFLFIVPHFEYEIIGRVAHILA